MCCFLPHTIVIMPHLHVACLFVCHNYTAVAPIVLVSYLKSSWCVTPNMYDIFQSFPSACSFLIHINEISQAV